MSAPPADVVDRLERLAAHAPGSGIDPDAIWTQGRRRQRVRLGAALAAVVAVGLLGATATPSALRLVAPPVATTQDADPLVLPDRVREPGRWEPPFQRAPGPLTAVGLSSEGYGWSRNPVWWGVSGVTGESRFLELSDASSDIEHRPVLSADGTRLAYWLTGDTPETLPDPDDLRDDDMDPVIGVAVLDLRSGETRRWETGTARGLSTNGMAWAGSALWWSAGDWDADSVVGSGSSTLVTRTWDTVTDVRQEVVGGTKEVDLYPAGPAPGGFVVVSGRSVRTVTGVQPGPRTRLDRHLREQDWSRPAVSPDGTRVAGIAEPDPTVVIDEPQALLVGDLLLATGGADEARLREVGGVEAEAVLGWRSEREVVVLTSVPGRRSLSVVDVESGDQEHLADLSGAINLPHFAADALTGEIVPAPDAPFAPDPRLVGLGLLAAAFVGRRIAVRVRSRRGHA
jgi:hypothetical protein